MHVKVLANSHLHMKQRHLAKSIQGLKSSSTKNPCTLGFLHAKKSARHCETASRSRDCLYTLIQKSWEPWVSAASMAKHRASPIVHALAGENRFRKLETMWGGHHRKGQLEETRITTWTNQAWYIYIYTYHYISLNLDSTIVTVTVVQMPWLFECSQLVGS